MEEEEFENDGSTSVDLFYCIFPHSVLPCKFKASNFPNLHLKDYWVRTVEMILRGLLPDGTEKGQ